MPTPREKTETARKSTTNKSTVTKKTHATPEYGLRAVDGLPPEPKRGGNTSRYVKLFAQVAEQPGQMFQIAEFNTRQSARRIAKRAEDGDIDMPGERDDWQVVARNTENGSALFAQYK